MNRETNQSNVKTRLSIETLALYLADELNAEQKSAFEQLISNNAGAEEYVKAVRPCIDQAVGEIPDLPIQPFESVFPEVGGVVIVKQRNWTGLLALAASLVLVMVAGGAVWIQQSRIARLNAEIEESQINNAIGIEDFSASGRNTIAVRGSVDPRYIKRVSWTVRDGETPRILYDSSTWAEENAPRVPIKEAATIELGTGRFTSVLRFEPFENAPEEFFPLERTEHKREFYAGFDGLITDPVTEKASVVTTLDYVVFKDGPNYYGVGGRVSPELSDRQGWIVAYAETSRTYYVLTELVVDDKRDPPVFHATCQLGFDRLDQQDYQLFVAFSHDPGALFAGQQAPVGFDWSKFDRSESTRKTNDGTDGFTLEPMASK